MKETKRYYFTPKELIELLLPPGAKPESVQVYARVYDQEYSVTNIIMEVTE